MINSKLLYWSVVVALAGFRFGASTIAASACVSEIAPPKNRGKQVALYQFNIVFGMPDAEVKKILLSIKNDLPFAEAFSAQFSVA